MDGLAEETIPLVADGALEVVDSVLVEAEALAVCRATMEAVFCRVLRLLKTPAVKGVQLLLCHNLWSGHNSKQECQKVKKESSSHTTLSRIAEESSN